MAKKDYQASSAVKAIRDRLAGGKPSEVIVIFVPSHDRHGKELANKPMWEEATLALFGRLYEGATAFTALHGVYQPKGQEPLYDTPTMIQSLTKTENIADENNLAELAEFCHNMGRKTDQASIGVVVNNKFIDITISSST